ncbi:hypothetical protein J4P02_27165 [Pseudomonas sp. NFXW11]|uniref:hypothetical protein n=1 Tax=Pseudomonas sp. NFXW11 TaxID=2819531 RepID=UPI003CEE0A60
MANEAPSVLPTVMEFAQIYLKRPLTEMERQVLAAYVQDKPVNLAQGAQQSVEQARQRAQQVIQSDGQRARQLIDQMSGSRVVGNTDTEERDRLLQQLLASAGSQAAAPPAAVVQAAPAPVVQAPALADDPALKAMLKALVQQEVQAMVETRMTELAQQVEATLKQIQAASEQ